MPTVDSVFVICPLHSQPGALIRGMIRPGPEPRSMIVLCPTCVEMGKAIRQKTGLEMVREIVKSGRAPVADAGGEK
jgi:hypothetical protein